MGSSNEFRNHESYFFSSYLFVLKWSKWFLVQKQKSSDTFFHKSRLKTSKPDQKTINLVKKKCENLRFVGEMKMK